MTASRPLKATLIFSLLAVLGVLVYWSVHRAPSELQLQNRFFQNQSDLVRLVEMSNQDPHVILIEHKFTYLDTDASWPRKNIGFTEGRWNEYRRIFAKLRLDGGISRRTDYPSSVFIYVYASGGVLGSSDRGYAYSNTPLTPIAESLDAMPRNLYTKNGHAIIFKPLTSNWYMFREEY